MFKAFSFTAEVQRFSGPNGWYYLALNAKKSKELRPLVTEVWPALLKVSATVKTHEWTATIMPIKDGPLFMTLTAPVRKKLDIQVGQRLRATITPLEDL